MNIVEAIYHQSVSPENLSELILDIIKGFNDSEIREINFYDIFLIIPFYTYSPIEKIFGRIVFNKNTSFQHKIERNPEICANFEQRYLDTIQYTKLALSYAINKELIELDELLNLKVKINRKVDNKTIYNISKVFSTKKTAYLYNFLKVNINDI